MGRTLAAGLSGSVHVLDFCFEQVLVNFTAFLSFFLAFLRIMADQDKDAGITCFNPFLQGLIWLLHVSVGSLGFHPISACLIILVLLGLKRIYRVSAVRSCAMQLVLSRSE